MTKRKPRRSGRAWRPDAERQNDARTFLIRPQIELTFEGILELEAGAAVGRNIRNRLRRSNTSRRSKHPTVLLRQTLRVEKKRRNVIAPAAKSFFIVIALYRRRMQEELQRLVGAKDGAARLVLAAHDGLYHVGEDAIGFARVGVEPRARDER